MPCEDEHHSHSHSHDDSDHVAPIATNESQSLRQYIDSHKIRGLNIQQSNDQLFKVFKSIEDKYKLDDYIESDADSQLILTIPFTGNVKLYSLILRTDGDVDHCPKTIKLFKNNSNLDFDNVNDVKPTFVINHPEVGVLSEDDEDLNDSTFVEHYLPRSLFQSTTQLTLFIENNWSDDEDELVKLYYIEIRGLFTSPITKDPIITLYESAANPADHKNLLTNEIGNHSNV